MLLTVTADLESAQRLALAPDSLSDLPRDVCAELQPRETPQTPDRPAGAAGGVESSLPELQGCFEGPSASPPVWKCEVSEDETGEMHAEGRCKEELGSVASGEGNGEGGVRTDCRTELALSPMQGGGASQAQGNEIAVAQCSAAVMARPIGLEADFTNMDVDAEGLEGSAAGTCGRELTGSESSCFPIKKSEVKTGRVMAGPNNAASAAAWAPEVVSMEMEQVETKTRNPLCIGDGNEESNTTSLSANNHPCGGSAHEAGELLPCGNLLENKLSQAELKDVSVAKMESSGQNVAATQSTGVGQDLIDNHWVHSRFDELAPYIRPHDEDEILGVCAEIEVVLGVDRSHSEQKEAEDSVRGEGLERLPAELSTESQSEVISEAEPADEGRDVPVLTRSEMDQAEHAVPCECVTPTWTREGGSVKDGTPCSAGLGSSAYKHCASDCNYCSPCNRNIKVSSDSKITSSVPAKHLNKSGCCPLGDNVPARAPSETTRGQSATPQACGTLETESRGAAQPLESDFSVRLSGEEDAVELLQDGTDLSRQAAHGEEALTEKQCDVRLENSEATLVAKQKTEDKLEQSATSEAATDIGAGVSADRTGSAGALGERDPDRGTASGGDGVKLGVSECRTDRRSQLNSEDEKDTLGTAEPSVGNPSALKNKPATDITPDGAGAAAVADGAAVNSLCGALEQETLSSVTDVEKPLTESESRLVSGSVEIPPQPRQGCKTAAVSDSTTESVCRTVELESGGLSTLNDKEKSLKETESIETTWQSREDCKVPCEGELDCNETSQSQGSCQVIPNCHAKESEIHEDPVDPATHLQTSCDGSGDGERYSAESSELHENRLDLPGHFRTGCDDEATPDKGQSCKGAEEDAERQRASDEELDFTEGPSHSQVKSLTSIDLQVEASAEGWAVLKNSLFINQQPADTKTLSSELGGGSEEIAGVPLEKMEHEPAVYKKSTSPLHAASIVACSQSDQALLERALYEKLAEGTVLSEGERTTECTLHDPSAPHTSECCHQKRTPPTEIDDCSKTSSSDLPCTSRTHSHSVPVEPGKAPAGVEGEFGKLPRKKRAVELRKQPGRSCKAGSKVPEPLQDLRRMRESNAQVFIRTQVANIADLDHESSETMNHAVHSGAGLKANLPKEERAFPSVRNGACKPHKASLNMLHSSVKAQNNIQEPLLLKLSNVASSLVPVRSPQKFRPFYRSSKVLPYRLDKGLKAGAADISVCTMTKLKPYWCNSFCCRLPRLKGHSLKNVTFQSLALSCSADLSKVSLYQTDRWKPLVTFTTPIFPVSFHVRLGSMSSLPSSGDDDKKSLMQHCASSNLMLHEESIQPPSSSYSSLSSEWTCSSSSPNFSATAGYHSILQNTTLAGFSSDLHPVLFTCSGSSEPSCRSCSFSECQELEWWTASSSPFSRFGLHTVLALSSQACYRVWTRRRCLGRRVPAVQKRFLSQFEEGLKGSSLILKESLFPSLHYSLGRIVAAWSSRGPAACLPDFTTFSCLDMERSYARQLLECFVASSFAEDRAAAGVANESNLKQLDCTLKREPCLVPLLPISDRPVPEPVFALLDQTAAQIRPNSLMAWSSLPTASCMECRASDSAQRSSALPEILGVSYPEMKEQSVLEKSLVSEPGQRTKRVSQIRIRKTVPKPDNSLTPMGLPKPKRLKKKEFSLEEIYTNKNYKSPPSNRSLETIFEEPKEKNGTLVCIGQQKRKRVLEFQDFTVPRKRRARTGVKLKSSRTRGRKAAKQGCAELDVLLVEKLSALEHFFNTEHINI